MLKDFKSWDLVKSRKLQQSYIAMNFLLNPVDNLSLVRVGVSESGYSILYSDSSTFFMKSSLPFIPLKELIMIRFVYCLIAVSRKDICFLLTYAHAGVINFDLQNAPL